MKIKFIIVALHPEGVDRNAPVLTARLCCPPVALHPEGVDRNQRRGVEQIQRNPASPSTRRAWIEISSSCTCLTISAVALHPEGVDRNVLHFAFIRKILVALHPEGVDRNSASSSGSGGETSRPPPGGRG